MLYKACFKYILVFVCSLIINAVFAVEVIAITSTENSLGQKIILSLSESAKYDVFTVNHSKELMIDIKDGTLGKIKNSLPHHVKFKQHVDETKARFSLNFGQCIVPQNVTFSEYSKQNTLEVNVIKCTESKIVAHEVNKQRLESIRNSNNLIVAIDAGHGGDELGAVGKYGTQEKDVTLSIARKLARLINTEQGMQAVLVRKDDSVISLQDRAKIARMYKADIFISLHTDAFSDTNVRGASVFVFSKKGAQNGLDQLIERHENASLFGEEFNFTSKVSANDLLTMSEKARSKDSVALGKKLLVNLKKVENLHRKELAEARFVVLRSPDLPSVLVEMGFISNVKTEVKLQSSRYQYRLAQAIFSGIKDYYREYPEVKGKYKVANFSRKIHVVAKNESLSSIALKYGVSADNLKEANHLKNNIIGAGKNLVIPTIY